MYDLPPEKVRSIIKDMENTQLDKILKSTPKYVNVSNIGEWVKDVIKSGNKMGVYTDFLAYKPPGCYEQKKYIVASCNMDEIKQLLKYPNELGGEWIEYNKRFNNRNYYLLNKVVFDVSNVTRENIFAKTADICKYLEGMSIAKTAFENNNYPLPDHISTYATQSIWELDHMRTNQDVPDELKGRYEEIYKHAVATYAQEYRDKFTLDKLSHRNKHKVREDYFKKNHITVTWDTVDDKFYDFMKKELKLGKYPDFIYYKATNPYITLKNLAKDFDKYTKKHNVNMPNFWKKDTGGSKYYIAYPANQEYIMSYLTNDYNTRSYSQRVSIEQLIDSVQNDMYDMKPLQTVYIRLDDFWNWNSLCEANGNIKWALNDGSYGNVEMNDKSSLEYVPILYKTENMDRVSAIMNRLTRERRDYIPLSSKSISEHMTLSLEQKRTFDNLERTINTKRPQKKDMDR